jgi:excinuclease UvrABC nuclease subunit
LDGISHIGPQKKKRLLQSFSGIEAIRQASLEELQKKAKLSASDAQRVHDAIFLA